MIIPSVTPLPSAIQDAMIAAAVWKEGCPVALADLRLVTVPYVDFAGVTHPDGEIIVHHHLAEGVAGLFEALLKRRFPIHQIRGIHHYWGDDEASMADNNTSAFNCRLIPGSKQISLHAYGMALDINPVQNPFLSFDAAHHPSISPVAGWEFMNRHLQKPGMVEPIVELVKSAGFPVWGGSWTTPIDYHHFQVERAVAEAICIQDEL